jgi:hypothetical protein
MRRLPDCGCACLSATTASRRACAPGAPARPGGFTRGRGNNAASPPLRYLRPHSPTVVYGMFSLRETSRALIPRSTIIEAATFITSSGQAVLRLCALPSDPRLAALPVFASTLFAPFGHHVQPDRWQSARGLSDCSSAHQVVRAAVFGAEGADLGSRRKNAGWQDDEEDCQEPRDARCRTTNAHLPHRGLPDEQRCRSAPSLLGDDPRTT